jgi:peptidoglycan/xylan/chitin deacetylase (PgdA/CDA1 family)
MKKLKKFLKSGVVLTTITIFLLYATSFVFAKDNIIDNSLFSECEDVLEWSSTENSSISIDTNQKMSNSGSLKFTANKPNEDSEYFIKYIGQKSYDFTQFQNTEFNIFLPDNKKLNTIAVFFMTDEGNFFYNYISSDSLNLGWNKVKIQKADFYAYGNPTWENINSTWIKVEAIKDQLPTFNLDKILLNKVEGNKEILPDNYVFSEFETLSDWTTKNESLISVDTSNKFSGNTSLKMTATAENLNKTYYIPYTQELKYNFSNIKNVGMNLYIPNKDDINSVAIFAMTDSNNFYYIYFGTWEMFQGWNNFTRGKSDFQAYGKPNWNNIKSIWFKVEAQPGKLPTINFDRLSFNNTGKTSILYTFDDASQSVYSFAYPVLKEKGFKATTWANKLLSTESPPESPNDYVDKFMSEDTLKKLYAEGWDIGNHTVNHNDTLNQLPFDQMKYEFLENQNWLLNLGFDRSAVHVCYPMGSFDKEITEFLPTIGVKSGRTTIHGLESKPVPDIYTLRTVAIGRDTDVAYVKDMVNKAIETGTSIIFMFHEVVPSPNPKVKDDEIKMSVNKFKEITTYIKSLSDQKKLHVQTINEWVDEYIAAYPKSVPANYVPLKKAEIIEKAEITVKAGEVVNGQYQLEVYNASHLKNVKLPTWTSANGQDELKWYNGVYDTKTTKWKVTVPLANHNYETGTYITHVYGTDSTGAQKLVANTTKQIQNLFQITTTKVSKDKYTVVLKNGSYLKNVRFQTWTKDKGQDDMRWYDGKYDAKQKVWKVEVKIKDFKKKKGTYITDVYAKNSAGVQKRIGSISVVVK